MTRVEQRVSEVVKGDQAVPEVVDVPVSDLLLDERNARLAESSSSQHDTILALAQQQRDALVRLAADIVENGVDPMALLAIVPTGDQRRRYRVLEGNRRLLALRALETPAVVAPALSSNAQKRLNRLADRYSSSPIESMTCALFASEDEAQHWIELRHTGQTKASDWSSGAPTRKTVTPRGTGTGRPQGK